MTMTAITTQIEIRDYLIFEERSKFRSSFLFLRVDNSAILLL